MYKLMIILNFVWIFLFIQFAYGSQLSEKDFPQHYVETYHALTPKDNPLVSRAYDVFKQVKNAADKSYLTPPNVVILKKGAVPPTVLKVGTILITQKTLELCYRGTKQSVGDARLSFIFGHELAHLAQNDSWIDEIRDQFISNYELQSIKKKSTNEDLQNELKADAFGMLYASMAGYDPNLLMNKDNDQIFFHDWPHEPDDSHPSPQARAIQLKQNIQSINSLIHLFHLGLRLYQIGKYDDALPLLLAFQTKFPCREVSNIIGLIYFQQAMDALTEFDKPKALQFKLAVVLDMQTRAEHFRSTQKVFHEKIDSAIWHFKMACEKDLQYVPARVNLSAAYILQGRINGAIDIIDEALKIKPNDPCALNNKGIAIYLMGPTVAVNMFQQAVNIFQQVIQEHPEFPDAYYNLAQIMYERKRDTSCEIYFQHYLECEPYGHFARRAQTLLGKINENQPSQSVCYQNNISNIPIKPGHYNTVVKQKINNLNLKEHVLPMGVYSGKYYTGNGYYILILEGTVELVEVPLQIKPDYSTQCHPLKQFNDLNSGKITVVFENCAVDIQNNKIDKQILY